MIKNKRIKEGYCYRCGLNPAVEKNKQCEICVLKSTAKRHLGDSGKWRDLRRILESQRNRCVYSNKRIRPGVNANLDHIIPKSKGGPDEIRNFQWVESDVNNAKGSLLEEDFLCLIESIYVNKKQPIAG